MSEALAAVITRLIAEMRRDYGGRDYWGVPWADRLEAALAAVGRTPEDNEPIDGWSVDYILSETSQRIASMGDTSLWSRIDTLRKRLAVGRTPREEPTESNRCLQHGDGCKDLTCRDSGRWVDWPRLGLPLTHVHGTALRAGSGQPVTSPSDLEALKADVELRSRLYHELKAEHERLAARIERLAARIAAQMP